VCGMHRFAVRFQRNMQEQQFSLGAILIIGLDQAGHC
jgi:hypothetical protein